MGIIAVLVIAIAGYYLYVGRVAQAPNVANQMPPVGVTTPPAGTQQPAPSVPTAGTAQPVPNVPPVATPAVSNVSVDIKDFKFTQASLMVKKGTTVIWTNQDSASHTVTSDNAGGPLASDLIAQGKTYSYTFNTVGTFAYHCKVHPNMKGTVTVTE